MTVKPATATAPPQKPLRILHVEDNTDDRQIIQAFLTNQKLDATFIDANNEADLRRVLAGESIDLVLADKSLPGFDGLAALRIVREKWPQIPFIFVSGSLGEEAAVDTIKLGATDYVLKDRLQRLVPSIRRAVREAEQSARVRSAEERMRQQAALLDKSQDAIVVKDMDDRIQYWNKSAERIYGWSATEIIGRKASELLTVDSSQYEQARTLLLKNGSWNGELPNRNRGGNHLVVESHWTLVKEENDSPGCVFAIDTDVTEKKSIEAKLLRSQRLDSLGALAGGIAHDLNNALAPVLMGAELLEGAHQADERHRYLDIINANAQRASRLVQQILSFARGTGKREGPVQVGRLVEEVGRMIRETFPKSIRLSINLPDAPLGKIKADPTEIHQVLLNLCVNARDAMPDGGALSISAENFLQDDQSSAVTDTKPGQYVVLTVRDTGTGIPPEVLPRLFEPFFTTKPNTGTGLGLSTVSSILKNCAGFIDIQTKVGEGTTFKVFFPTVISTEQHILSPQPSSLPVGHGELILVIDDEESLLELTKTMLESFCYRVMTAANGLAGIARFRENENEIKLVITDSDMPHLNGRDTVRTLKELSPGLPIIIASGGPELEELRRSLGADFPALHKPFKLEEMLHAVTGALRHASS